MQPISPIHKKAFSRTEINCQSITDRPLITYQEIRKQLDQIKEEQSKFKKKRLILKINRIKTENNPSPKHFNISKKIREIRSQIRNREIHYRTNSNLLYSKDKANLITESTKLLSDLEKKKITKIEDNNYSVSTFILENKEISKKNMMIKILREEKNKIKLKENQMSKIINDYERSLNNDEKFFDNYKEKQKYYFKEIENNLFLIEKQKKEQLKRVKELNDETNEIEDDIEKTIIEIENCRIYANFVNTFFGRDCSKFNKSVLIKDIVDKSKLDFKCKKFNIEKTTKNVFKSFDFCLKDNYNNEGILKEYYKINDTFERNETDILSLLTERLKDINTIDYNKERHKKILDELQTIYNNYEREYNNIYEEYLSLKKSIRKESDVDDKEYFFGFINDLYDLLFSNEISNDPKFFKKGSINELVNDCTFKLKDMEDQLNKHFEVLEKYEKDSSLFYSIVNYRRNLLREDKQVQARKKQEEIQHRKRKEAEARHNKIIIQSRKTEGPFNLNKKEKVVIIPEDEQKIHENDQFINY